MNDPPPLSSSRADLGLDDGASAEETRRGKGQAVQQGGKNDVHGTMNGGRRTIMSNRERSARKANGDREQNLTTARSSTFSPIAEENPTSPISQTPSTISDTISSGSARTIRDGPGLSAPTQSTPTSSYPFPSMSSPRHSAVSFHKPFMALSPTSGPTLDPRASREHTRDMPESGSVTPSSVLKFLPPSATKQEGFPEFPSPNLYDATLKLNSEPGLDLWWSNLVQLLQEHYKAHRATLSVPADTTDVENVPWGQKATFDLDHDDDNNSLAYLQRTDASISAEEGERPSLRGLDRDSPQEYGTSSHVHRSRPSLESRHSFAGFDARVHAPPAPRTGLRGRRPLISRAESYRSLQSQKGDEPTGITRPELSTESLESHAAQEQSELAQGSLFQRPFEQQSKGRVIPVLQALDYDANPLIDSGNVNRVLKRGSTVVLSREYADPSTMSHSPRSAQPSEHENVRPGSHDASVRSTTRIEGPWTRTLYKGELCQSKEVTHKPPLPTRWGAKQNTSNEEGDICYEEFEQVPASPWSQSPAPSPAIRNETAENPFFADPKVDEESFNPTQQDYTDQQAIEAIGLDTCSTIVHIPLLHPLLSRSTRSPRLDQSSCLGRAGASDQDAAEQKTPIAILSILSDVIPYPSNLVQSLNQLAPHLATSFSLARHHTNVETQAASLLIRRHPPPSRSVTQTSSATEGQRLEDLANLNTIYSPDAEDGTSLSVSGSVTSPSEHSGLSRSPSGSLAGTPSWDPSGLKRTGDTIGQLLGSEAFDSYFQARKRQAPFKTDAPASHNVPHLHRQALASHTLDAHLSSPSSPSAAAMGPRTPILPQHSDRGRGLLHSHGADFGATFQSLPTASDAMPRGPARPHARSASESTMPVSVFSMPPPSERLLRTIIDAIPVQIFTAGPQTGNISWVNSKFLAYRGQTVEDFLNDPWQSIHPEQREDYLKAWSRSLRDCEHFSYQVQLRRFDGNYRWFFVRAAPLRDTRGVAVHWFGTNMDIHEQHIAEVNAARQQETAASESKYRALANSSPQIVFAATDSDGIIFANTQWLSYSGQGFEDALGLGFTERVHPDDLAKCKLPGLGLSGDGPPDVPITVPVAPQRAPSSISSTTISDLSSNTDATITAGSRISSSDSSNLDLPTPELSGLAETGILKVSKDADGKPSYSTEVRLKSKDGVFRWHLVRCIMVDSLNFGNGEGSWFGTCTDINDHKLLEQKMKETMDSKTRFLSNMSHEIRTPLIGISGMVEFLNDTPLNPEQVDYCNTIQSSSDGLLSIVNDILDLSKIEAGMMTLSYDWFHIRSVIESVTDVVSSVAINKRLELNYLVDEDVPLFIKGDQARIRQVLMNVLGNAVKFTSTGEVFAHCQLQRNDKLDLADDEVILKFEVIDTGPGFTGQQSELIFKPFSQVDGSSTRQYGGSGLGLVISRQLVEMHGGKMSGTGVPDKGSTFVFSALFSVPKDEKISGVYPASSGYLERIPANKDVQGSDSAVSSPRPHASSSILAAGYSQSPPVMSNTEQGVESPAPVSSGSSAPSITSSMTARSDRSSMSSVQPNNKAKMDLMLPVDESIAGSSSFSSSTPRPQHPQGSLSVDGHNFRPPLYSILVICPQPYSLKATTKHIEMALPKRIPHQVTPRGSFADGLQMVVGHEPVVFSHIVMNIQESEEVVTLLTQVLDSLTYAQTHVIILADARLRNEIKRLAPTLDFTQLEQERRLQFLHKPVKPARFADIFDPTKFQGLSTDLRRSGSEQILDGKGRTLSESESIESNKGRVVLLVEDNPVNQKVLKKYVSKAGMEYETANDGVECTELLYRKGHGHYALILCDLHMPNKDGYQTCKEIRRWERKEKYAHLPIIALSANVMDDVLERCIQAGFSDYVTKPVDFKSLSKSMSDQFDSSKPHELMRNHRQRS
ncbi:MAG: hypothetical protein M1833_002689 [Piccolia ochrophora]|nr:MAG: hypothetical protein M1833_002689 [Piccolia ochrophora]